MSRFSELAQGIVGRPFGSITEMYTEAARVWKARQNNAPIPMTIAHIASLGYEIEAGSLGLRLDELQRADFDKTYFLLAATAAGAGGGGNGNIIIAQSAGFPEPPNRWTPIPVYDNSGRMLIGPPTPPTPPGPPRTGSPAPALFPLLFADAAKKEKRYEYVEKFSRGEIRASAAQAIVIASVATSTHQTLLSEEVLTSTREELLRKLEDRIKAGLRPLYDANPAVQNAEAPGVQLNYRVDEVTGEIIIVNIPFPVRHADTLSVPLPK